MNEFLYVSLRKGNGILIYSLDEQGIPGRVSEFPLPGGPAPMASNPQKNRLFVGLRDSRELVSLRLFRDGHLEKESSCALPNDPCFVGTDQTGAYVFSAYYGAGELAVHRWNRANGDLVESQRIRTEPRAHSLKIDPSNRWVFSPHTEPNRIYCYEFDGSRGLLNPTVRPFFQPARHLEPRHLCFHPFLNCLYVVNENSSSLSFYSFDKESGGIELKENLSTLPDENFRGNLCAELRIQGDGRFIYTSNRGHDSITVFSLDLVTGAPSFRGIVAVPPNPRSFDLNRAGSCLYAAGVDSGDIAVYCVDPDFGTLHENSRFYAGEEPMWLMTVSL
jgi:6-phosphogluconolactonase